MRIEIDVAAWEVISEISTKDLEEALAARRKEGRGPKPVPDEIDKLIETIDHDCLETALWNWETHRVEDAMYFLEKALGRKFSGLANLVGRRTA